MEQKIIITTHPEFADAAVAELQQIQTSRSKPQYRLSGNIEELAPGILLCDVADARAFLQLAAKAWPIFVRHLAPVQEIADLANEDRDLAALATAVAQLPDLSLLGRGTHFAVQTRFGQTERNLEKRPYTSGQINQALAEMLVGETGAVESIKKPEVIISLLCTMDKGYVGISLVEENLSDWPGGARRFAQIPEQISRAEFKLLEALEVFGVTLPMGGQALDLGAAPGGWTRLLLEAGLHVVAVDPAQMDPQLLRDRHLEHYRGYAERYLEEAIRRRKRFDIIANDMRMDARDAARLLVQAASCLRNDGFVISTLKLPHAAPNIDPLINLQEAIKILRKRFGIVRARQLYHNRQEVTVVAGALQ